MSLSNDEIFMLESQVENLQDQLAFEKANSAARVNALLEKNNEYLEDARAARRREAAAQMTIQALQKQNLDLLNGVQSLKVSLAVQFGVQADNMVRSLLGPIAPPPTLTRCDSGCPIEDDE